MRLVHVRYVDTRKETTTSGPPRHGLEFEFDHAVVGWWEGQSLKDLADRLNRLILGEANEEER